MKIAIGCDHAGIDQKPQLAEYLESKGIEVLDEGCHSNDRVDYPDYAVKVCQRVADGEAEFGVLICGTGIGMSIAANKVAKIRAANVVRADMAPLARQHNDANVIALSARYVTLEENEQILDAFLDAQFEGGRHAGRVEKINALD